MIPFFVADRPISLRILKNTFAQVKDVQFGLMTHAFTTGKFKSLYKKFPYGIERFPWQRDERDTLADNALERSTIKICDSGIFTKGGCNISYEELFQSYNQLEVDYGVMIDHYKDWKKTLKSAKQALRIYNPKIHHFKLITVAQGNSRKEYIDCYRGLRAMESQYIAIGGLLKKQEKSARWVSVKDENLLFEVLCKIREEFDPEWLFSLGTYSPRRHRRFEELGLFGSDYKGWIFNYTHRNRRLEDLSRKLEDFERSKLKPYWRKFSSLANRRDRLQRQLEGPGNRRELATAKRDLDSCYAKLLDMRGQILGVDGLPKDYKRLVKEFAFLVNTTEQEIRIRDIQRHILTKVFAQM